MSLSGYNEINANTTVGGAPIGAGQIDALRQNGVLFERLLRALTVSPLVPIEQDDHVPNPDPQKLVLARSIEVNATVNLEPQTPLVWFATERIEIQAAINGAHRGAPAGQAGDFGGSGGGGATNAGADCLMPVNGNTLVAGGATPSGVGTQISEAWASRILAVLTLCQGGAGGGKATAAVGGAEDGGAGGGVVILCAPEIVINGGSINVQGQDGQGTNAGGGGGGMVVLSAHSIQGVNDTSGAPDQTIFLEGGAGNGTGGNGGAGRLLSRRIV